MNINFSEVPAVYINLDGEPEKRKNTEKLLAELGFLSVTRSPGVLMAHKRAGVAEAHLLALTGLTAPVAVFEDDCELTVNNKNISIPDDADALFLGHIGITADNPKLQRVVSGVHYWEVPGYPDVYKVQGLLSAHALLYLSNRYLQKVRDTIHTFKESYTPQDVFVSEIQKEFNVYCLGAPMVIQLGQYKEVSSKHITAY